MILKDLTIDKTWTLFLDRDGVINYKIENDYVRNIDQFQLLPHVLDALKGISIIFGRIIVVTNQRGIARGLITQEELTSIHNMLVDKINISGGRIDRIYTCPHDYEDNCNCRKPKIGMALLAKKDFPEIDFKKSIMVGDSESDMIFGQNIGMTTVMISNSLMNSSSSKQIRYSCLYDFYLSI